MPTRHQHFFLLPHMPRNCWRDWVLVVSQAAHRQGSLLSHRHTWLLRSDFSFIAKLPFLKDDKGTLDLVNEKMEKENHEKLFQTQVTLLKLGCPGWPQHWSGSWFFLWDTRT